MLGLINLKSGPKVVAKNSFETLAKVKFGKINIMQFTLARKLKSNYFRFKLKNMYKSYNLT